MRRIPLAVFLVAGLYSGVHCQTPPYPEVLRLQESDPVFRQLTNSIATAYRAERGSDDWPDLFFARYRAREGDDVFSIAARLNLPYDTLVTLNGLQSTAVSPGTQLLLSSIHGLFIPLTPRNDMDYLLIVRTRIDTGTGRQLFVANGKERLEFFFLPGVRMNQTERGFYLGPGFVLPLKDAVLSSRYGARVSPIDGHLRQHNGIDLAAPRGTPVYAAKTGTVVDLGQDEVLGNYLIIDHGGGLRTTYGHLDAISIELNQKVVSSTIVGKVGSTGWSTGPHLHFEITLGSSYRDPLFYLPGLKP